MDCGDGGAGASRADDVSSDDEACEHGEDEEGDALGIRDVSSGLLCGASGFE